MYDVIIIGKGPAGLSAALYTTRSNLKTLIIGGNNSRLLKADRIDNFFGFANTVSGETLLHEGERQVSRFGAEIEEDEVIGLEKDTFFKVTTSNRVYEAKAILMATGQPLRSVSLKGLAEFEGRGVSYCTTCDGFFYNNLKVGVLGFKDYALHEAAELLANTKDITIFTNGKELSINGKNREALGNFKLDTRTIAELQGGEFLEKLKFADGTSEPLDGLFVAYESASSLDFARKLGIFAEGSAIKVDSQQQTNIEGLFAAGDCTGGFKQISTAVGQGAVAGKSISDYVRKH
jgi:thioredoxin reductase (NADPH)